MKHSKLMQIIFLSVVKSGETKKTTWNQITRLKLSGKNKHRTNNTDPLINATKLEVRFNEQSISGLQNYRIDLETYGITQRGLEYYKVKIQKVDVIRIIKSGFSNLDSQIGIILKAFSNTQLHTLLRIEQKTKAMRIII